MYKRFNNVSICTEEQGESTFKHQKLKYDPTSGVLGGEVKVESFNGDQIKYKSICESSSEKCDQLGNPVITTTSNTSDNSKCTHTLKSGIEAEEVIQGGNISKSSSANETKSSQNATSSSPLSESSKHKSIPLDKCKPATGTTGSINSKPVTPPIFGTSHTSTATLPKSAEVSTHATRSGATGSNDQTSNPTSGEEAGDTTSKKTSLPMGWNIRSWMSRPVKSYKPYVIGQSGANVIVS